MCTRRALLTVRSFLFLVAAAISTTLYAQVAVLPPAPAGSPASLLRATLARQRDLVAAHPQDPAKYIDLAYSLSDAGAGEEAQIEAHKATLVAPQSSFAYNAEGWVLHHNSIGVDYGAGYAYAASLAAYRKAIDLDPTDLNVRQSLASSLEFDPDGVRYAPDAHLADAIAIFRYVKAHQQVVEPQVEDTFLIDMFYAGQFSQVVQEVSVQASSPVRDGIALAALAAAQGPQVAIAGANQITGDGQRRIAALNFAAEGLYNMRLYPQAAALLSAGLADGSETPLGKIHLLADLKPFQQKDFPADDPRLPVQRLVCAAFDGTLTDAVAATLLTRHTSPSDQQWQQSLLRLRHDIGIPQSIVVRTGLPRAVLQDMVLNNMQLTAEQPRGAGYPIDLQLLASAPLHLFVTHEDGTFKIVAASGDRDAIGNEALYLLQRGNEPEARALLDWEREQLQKAGDDDPLGGVLFARMWTTGSQGGVDAIRFAALSLMSGNNSRIASLPSLIAARDHAHQGHARTSLDLLIASIYLQAQDGTHALPVTQDLLRRYPQSPTAIGLLGQAYRLNQNWAAWNAMLDARLATHPDDRDLLVEKAQAQAAQSHYLQAQATYRTLLDSGHALGQDYNMYAWLSLFTGVVDAPAIQAAQQANLDSRNVGFSELHTLACVLAAQGKTTEARQALLQAMSSANLVAPDSAVWFGFGLIYQQMGERDAAIAAYKRVTPPLDAFDSTDTYVLAQAYLKQLAPG